MAYKFGDMVYMKNEGGTYMVVGPYIGGRAPRDTTLPAVWIADISTPYMEQGEGGTVWVGIDELRPIDE